MFMCPCHGAYAEIRAQLCGVGFVFLWCPSSLSFAMIINTMTKSNLEKQRSIAVVLNLNAVNL